MGLRKYSSLIIRSAKKSNQWSRTTAGHNFIKFRFTFLFLGRTLILFPTTVHVQPPSRARVHLLKLPE